MKEKFSEKMDRLVLKTTAEDSPEAQTSVEAGCPMR
jgi:hypothetical protein